jgi:hypothetical protein
VEIVNIMERERVKRGNNAVTFRICPTFMQSPTPSMMEAMTPDMEGDEDVMVEWAELEPGLGGEDDEESSDSEEDPYEDFFSSGESEDDQGEEDDNEI